MEVFRAVMLAGSVKGAATLLHVSQPAASKLLSAAERRSGLRLFERVKGRLVATQAAHQLYTEIETVWQAVARVQDMSRELARPRGGSLYLAASSRFCTFLLPTAVTRLFSSLEALDIRVEMVMPHLVQQALITGIADLGIIMRPSVHPSLIAARSYTCGLVCVMPLDHRLASRKLIKPADLNGERLIGFSKTPVFGDILERVYDGVLDEEAKIELEVSSGPIACWFAQAGGGIAVLDETTVAGHPFPGLVARPLCPSPQVDVHIMRNASRKMSHAADAFCAIFDDVWKTYVPIGSSGTICSGLVRRTRITTR
jgi:DNA-binding transcriptional LysR family regulator